MDPAVALVPVRLSPQAKLRLAHILGREQRAELVSGLLDHVVGALRSSGLEAVVLAAGDPPPGLHDAEVWPDPGRGLNGGLAWALDRLGGRALVVPADLPWLTPGAVLDVLGVPGDVVVVRAADGGTGALLLRRPLSPAFGPRSALRHAAVARRAGLDVRVVEHPAFRWDVDDETTLRRVPSGARLPRT